MQGNEQHDFSSDGSSPALASETGKSRVGYAIVSLCLFGLLIDAVVETFLSESSLRWYLAALVALYLVLNGVLWRRLHRATMAAGSVLAIVVTVAVSAWLPGGMSSGLVALGQPTDTVLSFITITAMAFALFGILRMQFIPRGVTIAIAILGLYGIAALALGLVRRVQYSDLFHGSSFWLRLPFWLQGAFVGSTVVVSLTLAAHVVLGTWKVRGRQLRMWAFQAVIMRAGLAIALAGLRGPREPLPASLSGPPPILPDRDKPEQHKLQPELNLVVNGARHVKVPPGAPLIFTLTLRNGEAARSALAADQREQLRQELEEQIASGEVTRQQADETLQQEPSALPVVPDISLTIVPTGFSFAAQTGGKTELPWDPRMVGPAVPLTAVLDGTQEVTLIFLVAPEKTASTPIGALKVRATFENHATGQWQGTATSNRVTIEVQGPPAAPSVDQQKVQQALLGEYYLAARDYEHALDAVHSELRLDSGAVDGLAMLGKILEGQQDYRGALDAYEKALAQSEARYPHADFPPFGLRQSVERMRARTGA